MYGTMTKYLMKNIQGMFWVLENSRERDKNEKENH